jgi:hypothetical protein
MESHPFTTARPCFHASFTGFGIACDVLLILGPPVAGVPARAVRER